MIEFHKIWIDQCEAAEGIRERYGPQDAIRYLIGEKLLRFLEACGDHPNFDDELPNFVAKIKEIFEPHEIVAFFEDADSGRVPDPARILNGRLPGQNDLDEAEVIYDAERILLIENAKSLLFVEPTRGA